jgi:hypothetical protein
MISKENFIKYMNELKELSDTYETINKAAEKIEMFSIWNIEGENLILDILEEVFNDKKDSWIGYFVYDLDFGRKWHEGCITDKNDIDIPLRNAEELYDFLMEGLNESI